MAQFTKMKYTPAEGLNSREAFATVPGTEEEARGQIQGVFDQVKDYINGNLISELESVATGASGADKLGSAAMPGVEKTPGVSAVTVRDQIAAVKAIADGAVAGNLTPGSISNPNMFAPGVVQLSAMSANSVDSAQYVDYSIDHEHLSNNCVNGDNIADSSLGPEHYTNGSIREQHLSNMCVTEGKIGQAAVSKTKLHGEVISMIPSLADGATRIAWGSDVGSYSHPGTYICDNDAIAESLSNCPTRYAFKMYTDYRLGTNPAFRVQTLKDRLGHNFERFINDGYIDWTPWLQLVGIIYGTSSSPPAAWFPAGTLYIQHEA
jgi:hypothetical protein